MNGATCVSASVAKFLDVVIGLAQVHIEWMIGKARPSGNHKELVHLVTERLRVVVQCSVEIQLVQQHPRSGYPVRSRSSQHESAIAGRYAKDRTELVTWGSVHGTSWSQGLGK